MSTESDPNDNDFPSADEATELVETDPGEPLENEAEDAAGRPRGGRGLALIALLAVVALGAGAAYWIKVAQPAQHQHLEGRLAALEATLDRQNSGREAVRAAVDAVNAAQSESTQRIDALNTELQQAREQTRDLFAVVDRLQSERAPGHGVWELREVEQLLIVAGQRLTLEQDVETALAALETADRRLQELSDPSWNALRRELAAEMNTLRNVGRLDVTGMALYLADQLQRVEQLPLRDGDAVDLGAAEQSDSEAPKDWRELAASLWQDLRKMVVIKNRQVPDYVAFDPQLRYLLQHSLRLELANARLAVLNRDTDNLRASTALIGQLLSAYFDTEAPAVAELSGRMAEYAEIDLNPPLPDISASLRLLRERRAAAATGGVDR